jgi:hypothetical protein
MNLKISTIHIAIDRGNMLFALLLALKIPELKGGSLLVRGIRSACASSGSCKRLYPPACLLLSLRDAPCSMRLVSYASTVFNWFRPQQCTKSTLFRLCLTDTVDRYEGLTAPLDVRHLGLELCTAAGSAIMRPPRPDRRSKCVVFSCLIFLDKAARFPLDRWAEWMPTLFGATVMIFASEVLVDWLKVCVQMRAH